MECAAECLMDRGFERSLSAAQVFWHSELPCLVELHRYDLRGTAPAIVGSDFVRDLGEDIKVKWSGLLDDDADHGILERRRVHKDDATPMRPHSNDLTRELETQSLEKTNPCAAPEDEVHRAGRHP